MTMRLPVCMSPCSRACACSTNLACKAMYSVLLLRAVVLLTLVVVVGVQAMQRVAMALTVVLLDTGCSGGKAIGLNMGMPLQSLKDCVDLQR